MGNIYNAQSVFIIITHVCITLLLFYWLREINLHMQNLLVILQNFPEYFSKQNGKKVDQIASTNRL